MNEIPIKDIVLGIRHRYLNKSKVSDIAESIDKIGLLNPITVMLVYAI